jgi:predicted MFS family arabinose efflux permease
MAGAALITAALAGMTWGLTEGSGLAGWSTSAVTALVASVVLAAAFVRTERRRGDGAMTPPALFGSRPLVALNLLTLLLYGALTGFLLLTPYRLITSIGYSATAAGAALLPFPLIMGLASPAMGRLAGRIGTRIPLIAGALLVAVGFALTLLPDQVASYWTTVLPSVVVVALGMVCAATPLTAAVLGSVDARHTGAASGLNSAVSQLGGVVAIALIGGVLATQGDLFVQEFRVAAFIGSLAALGAAACIVFLFNHTLEPSSST